MRGIVCKMARKDDLSGDIMIVSPAKNASNTSKGSKAIAFLVTLSIGFSGYMFMHVLENGKGIVALNEKYEQQQNRLDRIEDKLDQQQESDERFFEEILRRLPPR